MTAACGNAASFLDAVLTRTFVRDLKNQQQRIVYGIATFITRKIPFLASSNRGEKKPRENNFIFLRINDDYYYYYYDVFLSQCVGHSLCERDKNRRLGLIKASTNNISSTIRSNCYVALLHMVYDITSNIKRESCQWAEHDEQLLAASYLPF